MDHTRTCTTASVNHFTLAVVHLRVTLMAGNELKSTGGHHAAQPQAGEPTQPHNHRRALANPLGVRFQAAMALVVIVLCTLTVAALEISLLSDESLSALEAVIGG